MSDLIERTEDDYWYCNDCDHFEVCRYYPMKGCEYKSKSSAQPESLCNTCRYLNLDWDEEPCDSCTMGGESNHYKPSAQPETKRARWIYGTDEETWEPDLYAWTCSRCGEKYPWQPNYCPHCGAKMEEDS